MLGRVCANREAITLGVARETLMIGEKSLGTLVPVGEYSCLQVVAGCLTSTSPDEKLFVYTWQKYRELMWLLSRPGSGVMLFFAAFCPNWYVGLVRWS